MENPIRKEQYLLRIAGYDTPIPIKPITREEQLLAAILENGSGADLSVIAPEYDPEDTYSEGDMRTHDGKLYKANQDISTAEEWNSEHWTETDIATELADVADPEAIAEAVGDWLGDHVDPETGYVIDDTFSVENAAPDSKKTGQELNRLKSAISEVTDEIVTDTYTEVTAVSNHTGNRIYQNATYNRLAETDAGSTRAYSVYAVTAGTYRIYGFGYDNPLTIMAAVGDDNIAVSGQSACNAVQIIDSGATSAYTWKTVEVEITSSGYLYVNCTTTAAAKVERKETSVAYRATTDTTLSDADLPANSKAVGDILGSKLHGIYVNNGDYYHFIKTKGTYLIRKFARNGINNLFDWVGTYLGSVSDEGVTLTTTIDTYQTDIIGPLSIWNNTLWPNVYGMWAGGNHGKKIEGTTYPTAEQDTFSCTVNGNAISANGLYYGDAIFKTKNKIYFPQSITGNDLTEATQSLNEYRVYMLDTDMKVKVRLEFVEDTRVSLYYGMEAVSVAYDTIECWNNNYHALKSDIGEAVDLTTKERKITLYNSNTGLTLDMELGIAGIGADYPFCNSSKYVYIPAQTGASATNKVYYVLLSATTAEQITSGMSLCWEGKYSLYYC